MTSSVRPAAAVSPVDRVLGLVSLLATRSSITVESVEELLSVSNPTARRLLGHVVDHGFARPGPAPGRFSSTIAPWALGSRDPELVRVCVRSALDHLARASAETVHFGVLEGVGVRFLEVIESHAPLRVGGRAGQLLPVYATSLGKAMLATLSDAQINALLAPGPLPKVVGRTRTARTTLMREVRRARRDGYAANREQSELGVGSVAVSLYTPDLGLLGALSIATPISRLTESTLRTHVELLTEARGQTLAQLVAT